MRRFERRGTEVPMEFTYEREDRPLGPFTDALRKQSTFSQSSSYTSGATSSISNFQPFGTPTSSFSNGQPRGHHAGTPSRALSPAEPPGGFNSQGTVAPESDEPQDVSMTSDAPPSPQKADDTAELTASTTTATPNQSPTKEKKGGTVGKLARRIFGKKKAHGRGEDGSSRGRRARADSDVSDNDAEDEASPFPANRAPIMYQISHHLPLAPGHKPQELGHWVSLMFWTIVLLFCCLFVLAFLSMVYYDVEAKVLEYSNEILHEINQCSQLYLVNKCHPETRIPAMETLCQNWERCLNKDPKVVSRVRVWAETLGDMFNGFVEPLAWKTLAFTVVTLVAVGFAAFWIFRVLGSSRRADPPIGHSPSYPMLPPATPSHEGAPLALPRMQSPFVQDWIREGSYVREGSYIDYSVPSTPRKRSK